jgi:zinc protease
MKVFKKNAAFFAIAISLLLGAVDAAAQTGSPQQEKLLNGMKVLMWSDPKSDLVSVRVRIHAGSAFDPQGKEGVMQLLADSLFPNAASREFFSEDLGGSLQVSTNHDFIEVNASAKPSDFLTMLETVSTAVSNPQIDKDLTAKLRNSLIARIEELEKDQSYVADRAVAGRLFGTFPYGRPITGTKESVAKIDFADLIDARQRFLTADNATVAVIGNFDKTLGYRAIRRYFGSWLKADRRVPSTFKQPDDPPAQAQAIVWPGATSAAVRIAFRGPARGDKDLGSSLIFARVVENRLRSSLSSAKDIFVRSEAHILPGAILIGWSFPASGRVQAVSLTDVTKFMMEPVAETEFTTAKQAVMSEWNKKDVATFWLDADTYKISNTAADIRAIESVSLADVRSYSDVARGKKAAAVILNPATN